MAIFLGFDLGTSYFKVGAFGADGALLGLGRIATPTESSREGIFEIPAPRLWAALRAATADALRRAKATASDVAGISYSSQANTFLLLDAKGEALTPLVVWTDKRAAPLDPELDSFGKSDAFLRTAGFAGLAPGFAVAKWKWFQRQEPALWSRAARVMTVAEYFTWSLTGETCGDASTAALTGAWDVARGEWWNDALARYGVARTQLSAPGRPGASVGKTTVRATELLGLAGGVPFAVGALDHYAGAIGAGIGRFGDVSISIGTVLAALQIGEYAPRANSYSGPHWNGTQFYRLTFTVPGATEVERYRNEHVPDWEFEKLLRLAAASSRGGVLISGTNTEATHGTRVREIIENLARAHEQLLRDLVGTKPISTVLATGGATRSRDWLQIVADVLRVEIVAPGSPEVACLGAAIFAAVAGGAHQTINEAAESMVQRGVSATPR